ncbi:MAG: histidine phosphatase family protein [Patescibacteria group bacterium]
MKKNSCTIYLTRHGETEWNVKKIIQGIKDIPLNKKGEEQARLLGGKLKNIKFDAVFSSDLIRAKRTAEIIILEKKLAVQMTKALRERYFGKYQGQSFGGEKNKNILNLINKLKSIPQSVRNEIESDEAIIGRLFTFLREISVAYQGKTVLIVTHGGPIKTLLIHLGWGTYENLSEGCIDNLAYVILESDGIDFFVKETSGITKKQNIK